MNTKFEFTVNKRQVNKNKTLLASVLYKKVEDYANKIMIDYSGLMSIMPDNYELDIVNSAILKDELVIDNKVIQLTENRFELLITVSKKNKELICRARFGYAIEKAS